MSDNSVYTGCGECAPVENIKEAKEAGCNDFMAKPFRVEDLLDKIQKYLKI